MSAEIPTQFGDSAEGAEDTPTAPESPYGESKLVGEWLLADQERATELRHTSLRDFKVVGSASTGLYDTSPHNLFPLVIEALIEGRSPRIKAPTTRPPDETCVRDQYPRRRPRRCPRASGGFWPTVGPAADLHLGSGEGLSVAQIMAAMAEGTGIAFDPW